MWGRQKVYLNKRDTRAIIHLENINHNLNCIKKLTGDDKKICIAVKADAYGHGAVEISKKALQWGVDFLAVATVSEAVILREAGIEAPILLFTIASDCELDQIVEYDITPFSCDIKYVQNLSNASLKKNKTILVHILIDTGMGRIGISPDKAANLAREICDLPNIVLGGVCTHFPVSESLEDDDIQFTKNQIKTFNNSINSIKTRGIDPGIIHAANSATILSDKEAYFDMVRLGISLYGYYPDPKMDTMFADLKPVMEFVSTVSFVKKVSAGNSISYGRTWTTTQDTYIGTISAGYGDGYNRLLSSNSRVLIKGKSYPVVGRICMDQFMVDLGQDGEDLLSEKAILFGPIAGGPDAAEIAEKTGTIPYEVTCNINHRVPRDYVDREE